MGGERTEASREREREGGLPSFLPSSSSSFLPCPPSLFFSSGWAFPLTPKSPFSPPPTLTHTQPLSLLRRRRSNIVRPSPLPSMPPFSTCLSRLLLLRRPTEPHPLFLSRRPRPGTAPAKRTSDSRPAHLNAHTCLKGKKACADRVEARKRPTVARIRDRRERKNKFTKLASGGNRSKEKEEGSDLGVRGSAGEKEEERGKR